MPKYVRLQMSGSFDGVQSELSGSSKIDKPAMLVYAGEFESMDGPVKIKDEDIEKLAANHNTLLAKLAKLASGENHPKHNPPIQLDHSTSARDTVGRLVGNLEIGHHVLQDGTQVKALFGKARILGKENVEKVEDGRWTNLSGGFDLETHTVSELTITPFPAAADASLLSKNRNLTKGEEISMGYKEVQEKAKMYDKCKKHLMETEKLSEEATDERLAALSDEDVKKMSSERDEHEKKLAAEEEEKKKLAAEETEKELKRMSAMKEHKEKLVKLSKGMKDTTKKVQLAAKRSSIKVRLAKLQAEQKVTPAEVKALDLDKMAEGTDEVINAQLSSYEKREPVIDVGLKGSTKALNPSQIRTQLSKIGKETAELKTRLTMPMKRDEALKRLSELGLTEADLEKPVNVHIDNVPAGTHDVDFEAAYGELKRLIGEGKEDEAKAHFKKHMAGSPAEAVASDSTAEISALADEVKKMHAGLEDLVKLAAPVFGATPEELV